MRKWQTLHRQLKCSGFLLCLFFVLCSASVNAQNLSITKVNFIQESINLSSSIQYLEDPKKQWQINDIVQHTSWQQITKSSLNFGFSDSAYWLRVQVRNANTKELNLILNSRSEVTDFIDFYILDVNNHIIRFWQTGDRRVFASRPLHTPTFTFPIALKAQQTVNLYLRIDTHDGLHEGLRPILQTDSEFISFEEIYGLIYGAFFGLLLSMILYNLFLYVSAKDKDYGLYSLFIFIFLVWSFTLRGYGFKYLWFDYPYFNNMILLLTALLMPVSLTYFLVNYLNLKQMSPNMHKKIMFVAYVSILFLPLILFGYYAKSISAILLYDMVSTIIVFSCAVYFAYKKSREAYYVLASFIFLAISVFIFSLMVVGVLDKNILTDNMPLIGASLEVMLLAYGLADKVNILQKKQRETEKQARLAQIDINERLSEQVAERTQELEKLNNELYRLSVIDELTQAFNRRMFNQQLVQKVAQINQCDAHLALCIIDIDYFKKYNDCYGHQEGDKALIMVSNCIRNFLFSEANSSFYRIGGEEFAILITFNCSAQIIVEEIKSLNKKVAELAIKHEKSPHHIITISQGLLLLESLHGNPDEVFKQADDLLYQAKEQGRNQTIFQHI